MNEILADNGKFRVVAEPDCDVENPRTFGDHLGTMVYSHRNYILGDEEAKRTGSYECWYDWLDNEVIAPDGSFELPDDLPEEDEDGEYTDAEYDAAYADYRQKVIDERLLDLVFLPLNVYEHSGITMSTGCGYPFNDRWDAGQVGWVYAWKADAIKWGFKEETWREQTEEALIAEVNEFDAYLTGSYYCLALEKLISEDDLEAWAIVDSICGIEGDYIRQAVVDYFGVEYAELAEAI